MQTNDVKTNDVVTENTGLVKKDYHVGDIFYFFNKQARKI